MRKIGVYQRSDGRIEARVPIGTDQNGKPKIKYILRKTQDLVLEAVESLLSELTISTNKNCNLEFEAVFEEWYNKTEHRVKESTAAN